MVVTAECSAIRTHQKQEGDFMLHNNRFAVIAPACIMLLAGWSQAETIELQTALVRLADIRELSVEDAGIVKEVLVVDGDSVEAGQLLVQLDDVEARTALQRAEKELEVARLSAQSEVEIHRAEKIRRFAEAEWMRAQASAQKLRSSFSLSELEQRELTFQQAVLDLEKARNERAILQATAEIKQSDVERCEHRLSQRRVEAPIGCVVARVHHRPGEWVEPGETLVRLVSSDRLWAEGVIAVADYRPTLKGSPASLQFTLAGDRPLDLSGEVVFVSPENDPHNGQIQVRVAFDNPDQLIRPGMKPRVRIDSVTTSLRGASRGAVERDRRGDATPLRGSKGVRQ